MNRTAVKLTGRIGLFILCVCSISCASKKAPEENAQATQPPPNEHQYSVNHTRDGVSISQTYTMHAIVLDIDRSTRSITLAEPDQKKTVFKAGDEVRNFDQIAVGDKVTATVWETLDVHLVRNGSPIDTDSGSAELMAGRAPKGTKPGGFYVTSVQDFASVVALDAQSRQATLKLPDGKWVSFDVSPAVDLTGVKPGDKVMIRHTEGASINVEGK